LKSDTTLKLDVTTCFYKYNQTFEKTKTPGTHHPKTPPYGYTQLIENKAISFNRKNQKHHPTTPHTIKQPTSVHRYIRDFIHFKTAVPQSDISEEVSWPQTKTESNF